MAALLPQLRQLHTDLQRLVDRDPEQEVTGIAYPLVDAVISEARSWLPPSSSLRDQVREVISPDLIDSEDVRLRAADALIVVGQLLVATETYMNAESDKQQADAQATLAKVVGNTQDWLDS